MAEGGQLLELAAGQELAQAEKAMAARLSEVLRGSDDRAAVLDGLAALGRAIETRHGEVAARR